VQDANTVNLTLHTALKEQEPDTEKIADILKYSTSEKYSEKERAVLDLAFLSGQSPNGAKKENFDKLLEFFSKDQILEIVSVIAAFGFLNRWNDTLGTVMEDEPKNFVTNELVPKGWDKF
jgi:alkylhydroperoxidase family enzyme